MDFLKSILGINLPTVEDIKKTASTVIKNLPAAAAYVKKTQAVSPTVSVSKPATPKVNISVSKQPTLATPVTVTKAKTITKPVTVSALKPIAPIKISVIEPSMPNVKFEVLDVRTPEKKFSDFLDFTNEYSLKKPSDFNNSVTLIIPDSVSGKKVFKTVTKDFLKKINLKDLSIRIEPQTEAERSAWGEARYQAAASVGAGTSFIRGFSEGSGVEEIMTDIDKAKYPEMEDFYIPPVESKTLRAKISKPVGELTGFIGTLNPIKLLVNSAVKLAGKTLIKMGVKEVVKKEVENEIKKSAIKKVAKEAVALGSTFAIKGQVQSAFGDHTLLDRAKRIVSDFGAGSLMALISPLASKVGQDLATASGSKLIGKLGAFGTEGTTWATISYAQGAPVDEAIIQGILFGGMKFAGFNPLDSYESVSNGLFNKMKIKDKNNPLPEIEDRLSKATDAEEKEILNLAKTLVENKNSFDNMQKAYSITKEQKEVGLKGPKPQKGRKGIEIPAVPEQKPGIPAMPEITKPVTEPVKKSVVAKKVSDKIDKIITESKGGPIETKTKASLDILKFKDVIKGGEEISSPDLQRLEKKLADSGGKVLTYAEVNKDFQDAVKKGDYSDFISKYNNELETIRKQYPETAVAPKPEEIAPAIPAPVEAKAEAEIPKPKISSEMLARKWEAAKRKAGLPEEERAARYAEAVERFRKIEEAKARLEINNKATDVEIQADGKGNAVVVEIYEDGTKNTLPQKFPSVDAAEKAITESEWGKKAEEAPAIPPMPSIENVVVDKAVESTKKDIDSNPKLSVSERQEMKDQLDSIQSEIKKGDKIAAEDKADPEQTKIVQEAFAEKEKEAASLMEEKKKAEEEGMDDDLNMKVVSALDALKQTAGEKIPFSGSVTAKEWIADTKKFLAKNFPRILNVINPMMWERLGLMSSMYLKSPEYWVEKNRLLNSASATTSTTSKWLRKALPKQPKDMSDKDYRYNVQMGFFTQLAKDLRDRMSRFVLDGLKGKLSKEEQIMLSKDKNLLKNFLIYKLKTGEAKVANEEARKKNPFRFNLQELWALEEALTKEISGNKIANEFIGRWNMSRREMLEGLKGKGFNDKSLQEWIDNNDYFPHEVIGGDFVNQIGNFLFKKGLTKVRPSSTYKALGSDKPINLNLVEVLTHFFSEWESAKANMEFRNGVRDNVALHDEEAEGRPLYKGEEGMPEGYDTLKEAPTLFRAEVFSKGSIEERIQEMFDNSPIGEQLNQLTPTHLLAMARSEKLVLPKVVIEDLQKMAKDRSKGVDAVRLITRWSKMGMIMSRYLPYLERNLISDFIQGVSSSGPLSTPRFVASYLGTIKDLFKYYFTGEISPTIDKAFEYGLMKQGLYSVEFKYGPLEAPGLKEAKRFVKSNVAGVATRPVRMTAKNFVMAQEAAARIALAKTYGKGEITEKSAEQANIMMTAYDRMGTTRRALETLFIFKWFWPFTQAQLTMSRIVKPLHILAKGKADIGMPEVVKFSPKEMKVWREYSPEVLANRDPYFKRLGKATLESAWYLTLLYSMQQNVRNMLNYGWDKFIMSDDDKKKLYEKSKETIQSPLGNKVLSKEEVAALLHTAIDKNTSDFVPREFTVATGEDGKPIFTDNGKGVVVWNVQSPASWTDIYSDLAKGYDNGVLGQSVLDTLHSAITSTIEAIGGFQAGKPLYTPRKMEKTPLLKDSKLAAGIWHVISNTFPITETTRQFLTSGKEVSNPIYSSPREQAYWTIMKQLKPITILNLENIQNNIQSKEERTSGREAIMGEEKQLGSESDVEQKVKPYIQEHLPYFKQFLKDRNALTDLQKEIAFTYNPEIDLEKAKGVINWLKTEATIEEQQKFWQGTFNAIKTSSEKKKWPNAGSEFRVRDKALREASVNYDNAPEAFAEEEKRMLIFIGKLTPADIALLTRSDDKELTDKFTKLINEWLPREPEEKRKEISSYLARVKQIDKELSTAQVGWNAISKIDLSE